MIRWLNDLLWESPPVEFESSFDLAESIARLKAVTRRYAFSVLSRQEAVGTVKESRVSLQRVIPMVYNSFKPFYRGHFIERSGKVFLVGRFTMHPLIKVFMGLWFSAAIFITIFAVTQALPKDLPFLFVPLALIAFATALVMSGKWLARNDPAWLSGIIRGALSASAIDRSAAADAAASPLFPSEPTSTSMTVVTVVLVVVAATCWLGAIFGIQSVHTDRSGSVAVTYFPSLLSRYFAAGLGTITLILAYGVYHRRLIAWRAGFGLIVGSWIVSIPKVFNDAQIPHSMAIIFFIATFIVMVIWARWWHAQRFHFNN